MQLIILAAGKSQRIFKKIGKNKCLIKINNKTLIEKIISESSSYFNKINIITGFKSYLIKKHLNKYSNIKIIKNKDYNKKEMLHSIITGLRTINDDVVISYSDILVSKKIWKYFENSLNSEIMIPIKKNWKDIWKVRSKLFLDDAETLKINKDKYLLEIGNKIKKNTKVDGQFMGIIFIPKKYINKILNIYTKNNLEKMQTTQFLNFLLKKKIPIKCKPNNYFWYEIDDITDLKNLKKIGSKID
jgi:choline kinase